MAEVIIFADIEDVARLYLGAGFAGRTGFTSVKAFAGTTPTTLPGEFVYVRRTGGPARNIVTDAAQLTVESYAKSGARAIAIANLARGLLNAAERDGHMGDIPVSDVNEFAGPYLDPDPNAPTHTRYSATFQVAARGTAA